MQDILLTYSYSCWIVLFLYCIDLSEEWAFYDRNVWWALFVRRQTSMTPLDSLKCLFFAGKHLADFKILQRMELPTSYIRIVRNVSVDQCAKLCVEVERINCASFSYCGNTSECVLSNVTATHIGQAISQRSLMCDVYSSMYGDVFIKPKWQQLHVI